MQGTRSKGRESGRESGNWGGGDYVDERVVSKGKLTKRKQVLSLRALICYTMPRGRGGGHQPVPARYHSEGGHERQYIEKAERPWRETSKGAFALIFWTSRGCGTLR